MKKGLIIIGFIFLAFSGSFAQEGIHSIKPGISAIAYHGDLSDEYEKWTSSFNLNIQLNNKKRINPCFNLAIGNIQGQSHTIADPNPEDIYKPTSYFNTSTISLNFDFNINIISRERLRLYLAPGFGIFRYNPKDEYDNILIEMYETRAPTEASYGNISIMFPFSYGISYTLKNDYGIGFQMGQINAQTDYIDNVSEFGNPSLKDKVKYLRFFVIIPLHKKAEAIDEELEVIEQVEVSG